MKPIRYAACLFALSLAPGLASAQTFDNTQSRDRLDRIERDVMLIQRQIARGGAPAASGDADLPAGGSSQLEVRLSAIEDQLRELRGKIEETDNRSRKLSENFDKLQRDVEFRLNELSGANPANAAAVSPAAAKPVPAPTALGPQAFPGKPSEPIKPQEMKSAEHPPGTAADPNSFSTPRELYNYAFRLLNQTQYEPAAQAFETFTKKYPKDPLIGNAYYWQGETFYIRRDYVNAADHFRQGYEALPEGPKAADNLLKLAMSLGALSREKEACLVLQQISVKFKKTSASVADKAEQEQKRINCK